MDGLPSTRYRRAVRAAPAPVSFNAFDLLVLGLIGRGHHARFVSTDRATYLVTSADDELVQWLAARMGAHVGPTTRLGFTAAYPLAMEAG